jgi:hypothetical protein
MLRYNVGMAKAIRGHLDGYSWGSPKHYASTGHSGVPSVRSEYEYTAHLKTVPTPHTLNIKSAVRPVPGLAITNKL